ncbi:peptidoglycan DD-metalloendopeptidase family protein [Motiliproteus sp. MSK22-1]|uniref:peptidoglycan DD-metalloendopeptidase family protein n=1 Tax=Motiliproteus sp. MSK22-1 TaxID=1897630 RepID=UPI001E3541E2|nr:peptidoglycan DD-metalloendopeptidase family protein [Motiliproteus sp. MSK22-1]
MSDRSLGRTVSQSAQYSSRQPIRSSGTYIVRKGDTLYSIAFRYGKDLQALARANGIGRHYRIYPGQKIRLVEAPSSNASNRVSSKNTSSNKSLSKGKPKKPDSSVKSSNTAKSAQAANRENSASSQVAVSPAKKIVSKKSETSTTQNRQKIIWQWPAKGKIIQYYQSKGDLNKGLNIAARKGDPVYAAATGSVVYAGSGLLGYGNLIIINHNQQYLSAYAHNSKIFVKEKDKVSKGEKIALAGNSGATRSMLHFEIRKDGKPVNPLHYLPKRK